MDSAQFVTREEAAEDFQSDYDEELFDVITDDTFRDRYVVQLQDISLMEQTRTDLYAVDGVAKVNAHLEYAEGFITARNIVSVISLILIVILIVVSFFIMTNTIKLATFTRREEIAIMKMVGASNGFIRCPFIVEGLVLGLLGGALAFLAEWGPLRPRLQQPAGRPHGDVLQRGALLRRDVAAAGRLPRRGRAGGRVRRQQRHPQLSQGLTPPGGN